jgi:hypothetical protein
MTDIQNVIASQEQGFTMFMCADAAIDVHDSGAIILYIAGREIRFSRPDRLVELVLLLRDRDVLTAIGQAPLDSPATEKRPPRRPPMKTWDPLDLAALTGRAAYDTPLICEKELALVTAARKAGLRKDQYSALVECFGDIAEAIYVTAQHAS